jgi:hypothetical protein
MRTKISMVLALVGLLALGSLYAGQSTAEVLKAKIDFPFIAGGRALPAGVYEFRKDDAAQVFRIQGAGRTGDVVNIITELAGNLRMNPEGNSLVFDIVNNKYVLSEIWIPGSNGYLVEATKGPHAHKVVKISG